MRSGGQRRITRRTPLVRQQAKRYAAFAAASAVSLVALPLANPQPAAAIPASETFRSEATATLGSLDIATPGNLAFNGLPTGFAMNRSMTVIRSDAKAKSTANADLMAGNPAPLPGTAVGQDAPPDNPYPSVSSLATIPKNPLLSGELGKLAAQARWTGCPTSGGTITAAQANLGNLKVLTTNGTPLPVDKTPLSGLLANNKLPIANGITLLSLPGLLYSDARGGVAAVNGQKGLGVTSTSTLGMADIVLFDGTPVRTVLRLAAPPTLSATAAGTKGQSKLTYQAPMLTIIGPDGQPHTIKSPDQQFTLGLDTLTKLPQLPNGLPDLLKRGGSQPSGSQPSGSVDGQGGTSGPQSQSQPQPKATAPAGPYLAKLTLGKLTDDVLTATESAGRVSMLRLDLLALDGKTPLISLALGDLKARAVAPTGGVTCKPAAASPTATAAPAGGGSSMLPVTGGQVTIILITAGALLLLGRFALILGRRRDTLG